MAKRILDQTEDTELTTGDCVAVDSSTEGVRKFDLGGALIDLQADVNFAQASTQFPDAVKRAMLTCVSHMQFNEGTAQEWHDRLYNVFYPEGE